MRLTTYLTMAVLLLTSSATSLLAQGRSIPKGSEAKAQEEVVNVLDEELPEGQKYRYPLLNGLNVSIDLFDPIMSLLALDHCTYEAQAMLDIHHRFFPMASFGMGWADETSDNGIDYITAETDANGEQIIARKQELNFNSKLAPFGKIGLAYNLRYNDIHPNDMYLVFARYGVAWNKADITNLYYANELWGAMGPIDIKDQEYTTHWLELGAMLKVQIHHRFSLGWDIYWKVKLAQSGTRLGEPYYVPGMGTADSNVGFSFRLFYEIF